MKWYETGKPIYFFHKGRFIYNLKFGEKTEEYCTVWYEGAYSDMYVVPKQWTGDWTDVIKPKLSKTPTGKVLYFIKESRFPRFKLMNTEYKRCIKPDKATDIVFPDLGKTKFYRPSCPQNIKVYEDKRYMFIIPNAERAELKINDTKLFNYLIEWGQIDPDYKFVGNYKELEVFHCSILPYVDLLYNKYTKPIITDNMLDIELSKTLPVMTEQDVDSINSMLASSDNATKELGLKMLTGFNIFATPTLIKALLFLNYPDIRTQIMRAGVAVSKLLNAVDFPRDYISSFPNWIGGLVREGDKYSDFESQQIKRLLIPAFKKYYDNVLPRFQFDQFPFIPKITITIE